MIDHPRDYCSCGKIILSTNREARRVVRSMKRWDRRASEIHAYRCSISADEVWHVGHHQNLKPRHR